MCILLYVALQSMRQVESYKSKSVFHNGLKSVFTVTLRYFSNKSIVSTLSSNCR